MTTDLDDYLNVEATYFGDWPEPPEKTYQCQLTQLANDLKKSVRNWAIQQQVSPEDYWKHVTNAREWLEYIRAALTWTNNLSEAQKERFHEQYFWSHQDPYQGGLIERKKPTWPINRELLNDGVEQYLSHPAYWSPTFDYILTDALIYAEVAAFRESLVTSAFVRSRLGIHAGLLVGFFAAVLKWAGILGGLYVARNIGSDVFIVLSIFVMAFHFRGFLNNSSKSRDERLLRKMVRAYMGCAPTQFNATAVLRNCLDLHLAGVGFDGVLFDLLEKQRIQNHQRWRGQNDE